MKGGAVLLGLAALAGFAALKGASSAAASGAQPKAGDVWTVTVEAQSTNAITPDALQLDARRFIEQIPAEVRRKIEVLSLAALVSPSEPRRIWLNLVVRFLVTPTKPIPTSGTWTVEIGELGTTRLELQQSRAGDHRLEGATEYFIKPLALDAPAITGPVVLSRADFLARLVAQSGAQRLDVHALQEPQRMHMLSFLAAAMKAAQALPIWKTPGAVFTVHLAEDERYLAAVERTSGAGLGASLYRWS